MRAHIWHCLQWHTSAAVRLQHEVTYGFLDDEALSCILSGSQVPRQEEVHALLSLKEDRAAAANEQTHMWPRPR